MKIYIFEKQDLLGLRQENEIFPLNSILNKFPFCFPYLWFLFQFACLSENIEII